MDRIRLLLVDDQVLFVENLKTVLEIQADDLEVVGIAYDGKESIDLVETLMPDIVLMDVRMPVMDGVEANRIIHQRFPSVKVMMLTTFDDDEYVFEAMSAGAVGYMLKDMPSEDLVSSIRAIRHGTIQISPKVMAKIVAMKKIKNDAKETPPHTYDLSVLSLREREVLYLLCQGQENMEIAGKLFLAEQTVKNHISKIYNKIGVHDRINAMKWARGAHLSEEIPYLKEKYH